MLNLFGPKGAGKNACAESLLHFFGQKQKVPNLHNTSKAALADHVATSANALCVLDEYRNDLEMEKREFLKGLWDGTGRTKMNMDKDKKKETTSVDQGVVICGQQMATADIALFSRFVVLSFTQTEYTKQEEDDFNELAAINKQGITHITHQVLTYREHFQDNFNEQYKNVAEELLQKAGKSKVETRILNNWVTIMTAYAVLESELGLPWNYHETMEIAAGLMVKQNQETGKNDDLGAFWKIVQYLISSNLLYDGGDYKYKHTDRFVWKKTKEKEDNSPQVWDEAKHLFILNPQRVFSLYKHQAGKEGDKPMAQATIEYYLKNSKAFMFETKKEGFKKIDPKLGVPEKDKDGKEKRTSTTAFVFDLELLDLSLPGNESNDEAERENESRETTMAGNNKMNDKLEDEPSDEAVELPF